MRAVAGSLAVLWILAAAASLHAKINGADVIELKVAQADDVVCGWVVEVTDDAVTVQVDEIIKGRPRQTLSIPTTDRDLRLAHDDGLRRLIFLVNDRLASGGRDAVIDLASPRPDVYTMDFAAVVGEEAILQAARDAARAPRPLKAISIEPPWGSGAAQGLYSGSSVFLRMPVDGRLEQRAVEWLAQGHELEAAQALREFPSPRNVERLKALLDNSDRRTSWWTWGDGRLSQGQHAVRDLAYRALAGWGIAVPRPTIVVPDDCYRRVRWWGIATVGLIAGLMFFLPRMLRRRLWIRDGVSVLLSAMAIIAGVLWVVGRQRTCELLRDEPARQTWLSAHRGWLQLTTIGDWPGTVELPQFIPFGESMDRFNAGGDPWPKQRLVTPRGLMYAVIPNDLLPELWEDAPQKVHRDENWMVAKVLTGEQRTWMPERSMPFRRVEIRWAVIVPLLAAYPLVRLTRAGVNTIVCRRRRKARLCVHCGYDLRGSLARCPECGSAADPGTSRSVGVPGEDSLS